MGTSDIQDYWLFWLYLTRIFKKCYLNRTDNGDLSAFHRQKCQTAIIRFGLISFWFHRHCQRSEWAAMAFFEFCFRPKVPQRLRPIGGRWFVPNPNWLIHWNFDAGAKRPELNSETVKSWKKTCFLVAFFRCAICKKISLVILFMVLKTLDVAPSKRGKKEHA